MAFEPIKPPVIMGTAPNNYRGPLYYRLHTVSCDFKKPLWESLSLDRRVKALAEVRPVFAAMRKDPKLCDANGGLLPELRTPFQSRLRKNARESWDEISWHVICLVSERVRDLIEEMAPGIHYFVRNDVDDEQGGSFRVYVFFCGLSSHYRPALSLEAQGIAWTPSTTGHGPVYKYPEWLHSDQFGYLDASVMNGAPLLHDSQIGPLFSDELVQRLGGAMPKGTVFVPMGVA